MKLVILMYLEEDEQNVQRMLGEHRVVAYSELPVEGHGRGTKGWLGRVAPYRSRMLVAFVGAESAADLLAAVSACTECADSQHPIRAWQMPVEAVAASGVPNVGGEA